MICRHLTIIEKEIGLTDSSLVALVNTINENSNIKDLDKCHIMQAKWANSFECIIYILCIVYALFNKWTCTFVLSPHREVNEATHFVVDPLNVGQEVVDKLQENIAEYEQSAETVTVTKSHTKNNETVMLKFV